VSDATILIRDMAGDAAGKAANRINPSDEQLSQIDRAADDNTWHEVPDLSKDNLRRTARSQYNNTAGVGKDDLKAAANTGANSAQPQDSQDVDAAATAGKTGAQNLADRSNITQEDQQRVKGGVQKAQQRTTNYLREKMPEERREQTIMRLKKMVVEIQGHPDYQQAIDTLLYLAETYVGHSKTVANQATGTVKDAHNDDNLTMVERDLRILIERFANYTSADDLMGSINNVYADADHDPELKNWFKHLDRYIRACLKEQGYILTDKATDEANQIQEQGNFLLRDRYRDHVDRIFDEFKFLANEFDADPLNTSFAKAMNKLFLELGNDENGKATFKPHLIKDLTDVVIPTLFENISYVPLPRIEYSDPMIDAIVENLIIESDNLFPNSLEVQSDNWFRWGRKTTVNRNKNKIMVAMSGVQMDLRDVSYFIHKKQGFPSVTDKGVMDIFMGGEGFSFKIAMETADVADKFHFFKVTSVKVNIKNLKLKLKQSNHKLLFNLVKPLLMAVVKPALTKIIEKQIKDSINQGDAYCYGIKKEADRAAQEAVNNPDPDHLNNMYQRYYNAFQAKITQGKNKTEEASSDKHANVAMTQQDSMFKDIRLPGGISTKATDWKAQAAKGDRWQSPVFGIGSAKETVSLPKAQTVQRKPHRTAQGKLNPARNGPTAYSSGDSHLGGNRGASNTTRGSNLPSSDNTTSGMNGGSAATTAMPSNGYGTVGSNSNMAPASTYASGGPVGATTGTGSTGQNFGNAVSQAFDRDGAQDFSLKNAAVNETTHTSLGVNNPVLSGSV